MSAKKLHARQVGLPVHKVGASGRAARQAFPFDLSSHSRARDALEFGLCIDEPGFNVFVLGEPHSGRMTATLAYLESYVSSHKTTPGDWVYLNNFRRPHKPKPYRLAAGDGRRFRRRMSELVIHMHEVIRSSLQDPASGEPLRKRSAKHQEQVQVKTRAIIEDARKQGIGLQLTPSGPVAAPLDDAGNPLALEGLNRRQQRVFNAAVEGVHEALIALDRETLQAQNELREQAAHERRHIAGRAISPALDALARDFVGLKGIARWIVELREDVLDHLELFVDDQPGAGTPQRQPPAAGSGAYTPAERRYAVNLLVDNTDDTGQPVIVEPNPSYQNLFGAMEYRTENGVLTTDFAMIRSGALHRANGGILVLRAEALAHLPLVWQFLKGALRDREIRIEEPQRLGSLPMTSAPRPKPIPLDIKIVIVGAPYWYYQFLEMDPEFPGYFKIKADIDPTMPASRGNIVVLCRLIRQACETHARAACDASAVQTLLGQSSRWAENRTKLTATIELIDDIMVEAGARLPQNGKRLITAAHVKAAIAERRERNARLEDRSQELIEKKAVLIQTSGSVVGQVNGLTVHDLGDHVFGTPARVTARTYVGDRGVVNIDRLTGHGGPIQQKGVFILAGYLHGLFADQFPISFSATVAFEQTYGGVEGDSASLAELCAIISSLSGLPLRQDIAITGSINQIGVAQIIGGLHHKIEGFFRACQRAGLSGTQGVILPAANEVNLVLRDEVAEAIAKGRFHLWSVRHVDDALALFTGMPAGRRRKSGHFPANSVYARVQQKLEHYDTILREKNAEAHGDESCPTATGEAGGGTRMR